MLNYNLPHTRHLQALYALPDNQLVQKIKKGDLTVVHVSCDEQVEPAAQRTFPRLGVNFIVFATPFATETCDAIGGTVLTLPMPTRPTMSYLYAPPPLSAFRNLVHSSRFLSQEFQKAIARGDLQEVKNVLTGKEAYAARDLPNRKNPLVFAQETAFDVRKGNNFGPFVFLKGARPPQSQQVIDYLRSLQTKAAGGHGGANPAKVELCIDPIQDLESAPFVAPSGFPPNLSFGAKKP